jgi:septum formation inhibitor-activating ATPase MinD
MRYADAAVIVTNPEVSSVRDSDRIIGPLHERTAPGHSDRLGILREEILAALGKHITIDQDNIAMRMDRGATLSTLEIEILIPHSGSMLVPVVTQGWAHSRADCTRV